jgi:hypothetical protein
MSADLPTWERPHLQPGGGDAHLYFKVHGDFTGTAFRVSRERHRCAGLPAGLALTVSSRADQPEVLAFGTEAPFRSFLDELPRERVGAILDAPSCAVLRGVVHAPETLDYLRDAVGIVQALVDAGGLAVFDPYRLTWWDGPAWTDEIFAPAAPVPHRHVTILASPESDGTTWLHTRGMLKFGRPDVSIHHLPPELHDAAVELCDRLIGFQALGAVVPDGQEIHMPGLPAWRCRTAGTLDDPDFDNIHLEIGPA